MKKLSFVVAAAGLIALAACSKQTPAENAIDNNVAALESNAAALENVADNTDNAAVESAAENAADSLENAADAEKAKK